jgi:hypothetical protein
VLQNRRLRYLWVQHARRPGRVRQRALPQRGRVTRVARTAATPSERIAFAPSRFQRRAHLWAKAKRDEICDGDGEGNALVEARAVILTVISNAMILESDYDPSQHPVIKQIDAALAKAKEPATSL